MMKGKKEILQGLVMGVCLPAVLMGLVFRTGEPKTEATQPPPATTTAQSQEKPALKIPVLQDAEVTEMDLEEYILGVLLAEMPPSFETEALKAQAVAARTFTLWSGLGNGNHTNAAVCTESTCCQGYLSPLRYVKQGGDASQVNKLRDVVLSTKGQLIRYQGELILASYFSCSGGSTEAAVAVWGVDYPYLQAVESPGEEGAAWFTDEKWFTPEAFAQALQLDLVGAPAVWFGAITYTDGGSVDTVDICGQTYRGTQLRSLLGLRSTAFRICASEEGIRISTWGFGHRVGMSQYGADAMARDGKDYRQILLHYYTGTVVEDYEKE